MKILLVKDHAHNGKEPFCVKTIEIFVPVGGTVLADVVADRPISAAEGHACARTRVYLTSPSLQNPYAMVVTEQSKFGSAAPDIYHRVGRLYM